MKRGVLVISAGQTFNRLVAVQKSTVACKYQLWEFKCQCGNLITTRVHRVMDGTTKSCGCLRKELLRQRPKRIKTVIPKIHSSMFCRVCGMECLGRTTKYCSLDCKVKRYREKSKQKAIDNRNARLARGEKVRSYRPPNPDNITLYFIHAYRCNLIKIGITEYFDDRLSKLRREGPDTLTVIKIFPGSVELEKQIHNSLAEYHHHGEWFENCPPVLAAMNDLK